MENKFLEKALFTILEDLKDRNFIYGIDNKFLYNNLKSGFRDYLNGDKSNTEEKFIETGRYFHKNQILFSLFFDLTSEIEKKYLEYVYDFPKKAVKFIHEIIDLAEDYFSYGFLLELINEDKDRIREKLKLFKGDKDFSSIKPFIRSHLVWINKLLEDIKKLRTTPSIELDPVKCEFGMELESGSLDLLIKETYMKRIKAQHKYIHKMAQEIYVLIKKKDYKNLLIEYIELINAVDRLITLISLSAAVSQESIINVDPLTGVLNRRSMEVILPSQYQASKISQKDLTIAMLDIDNFKQINDKYGHIVGDCVLKQVAQKIRGMLRKSDFVFRYGGEEFLVLLTFTDKKDAVKVLERIRQRLEENPVECKNIKIKVTVSVGVASLKDDKGSIERLINLADKRLYKAKKSGKNRVIY